MKNMHERANRTATSIICESDVRLLCVCVCSVFVYMVLYTGAL